MVHEATAVDVEDLDSEGTSSSETVCRINALQSRNCYLLILTRCFRPVGRMRGQVRLNRSNALLVLIIDHEP